MGDFDGDGKADIATFIGSTQSGDRGGDVYVALSDGGAFRQTNTKWQDLFCINTEVCETGDFNGDGKDDIVAFEREPSPGAPPGQVGNVYVSLSNGSSFGATGDLWQQFFCIDNETCAIGDFNGDGKDDIVTFVQNTNERGQQGDVYVALSDGTSFGPSGSQWQESFCLGNRVCGVGDFNGDGKDDVVTFVQSTQTDSDEGNVYVALSDGTHFGDGMLWNSGFCIGDEICATGDVNGDGRSDAVAFVRSSMNGPAEGDVYVALSQSSDYLPLQTFLPFADHN